MSCKYPDRWLDYSKYGSQVQGTQFIALKVPLGKKYATTSKESFTPDDAVQEIPGLGLVIDLTFTSKYYNPKEFLNHDVQHKKIFTKGHEIPKRALVDQFIRAVNDFLGEEQNKDKLIGVHCTHGLNRTGYFVCAYMILVQGQAPKSAISLFNEARAHSMERANYLNSLTGLIPLSYKAHESQADAHETNGSWRDHRSRYDRRADNYKRNQSRENHDGYNRSGANSYRDRSNNWRTGPAREDRSNNWSDKFSREDRPTNWRNDPAREDRSNSLRNGPAREDRFNNSRNAPAREDRPNNWRNNFAREDRPNNWRNDPVRDDRPNNWRNNFVSEDRHPYRNYREYHRQSNNGGYEDRQSTPRNNGEEACNSSYSAPNGDHQQKRFKKV